MSNEIYYTVEKIRKSPQGYTFFISSSMGTKFEMLVSNEQYERFDIAEGEYKDFFANDLKAQTGEDKKWKGVLRLWLPKDDGSDKDEVTKSILKGFVTSVEKSNPGYLFDWNEASLAGKQIGVQ